MKYNKRGYRKNKNSKSKILMIVSPVIMLLTAAILIIYVVINNGVNGISSIDKNSLKNKYMNNSELTIIIDPGHGGEDAGATGLDGILEKDVNLEIAKKLRDIFQDSDYNIVMTRETDDAIGDTTLATIAERKKSDMTKRLDIINSSGNCIFVSIHQNSFSSENCYGAEVFYSPNDSGSKDLAESIKDSIVSKLQPDNTRPNKKADDNIFLLYNSQAPSVLVECGFITNQNEADNLTSSTYQQEMAQAIYDGIINYLS